MFKRINANPRPSVVTGGTIFEPRIFAANTVAGPGVPCGVGEGVGVCDGVGDGVPVGVGVGVGGIFEKVPDRTVTAPFFMVIGVPFVMIGTVPPWSVSK